MVDLDDASRYGDVDPQDALGDVEATADQWAHARELTGDTRIDLDGARAVVVLGMGGSGICGDVVAAVADQRLPMPVLVHKGYGLPAHVGPDTVVLTASYSGNTEETLSAVDEAIDRGARVAAVTSGGQLGELVEAHDLTCVQIPGGGQPRHSLGYLAVPALLALGLADGLDEAEQVLRKVAGSLGRDVPTEDNPAKQLGGRFADGAVPVVYGTQGPSALAALRLACQLNENAKLPAFPAVIPELDHNAIVGWEGPSDLVGRMGLVWVRDTAGEHPRNSARVEITTSVVAERFAWTDTLESVGSTLLARIASLLLAADLVSLYAALARGVDPTPVRSIDRLKSDLAGRET
jgi:glucose/mannose-6-phosphate isomerase